MLLLGLVIAVASNALFAKDCVEQVLVCFVEPQALRCSLSTPQPMRCSIGRSSPTNWVGSGACWIVAPDIEGEGGVAELGRSYRSGSRVTVRIAEIAFDF